MSRRIAIIGVSGNGKTTLAKRVAERLAIPHVELDALCHLPNWREASNEDFRKNVGEAIAKPAWVLDGTYERKLGNLIYEHADTVVWLDLPLSIVLYRLLGRVVHDLVTQRNLFNGNRQSLKMAFFVRDNLVGYAIEQHARRRRDYPRKFATLSATHGFDLVRLQSVSAVEHWLGGLS